MQPLLPKMFPVSINFSVRHKLFCLVDQSAWEATRLVTKLHGEVEISTIELFTWSQKDLGTQGKTLWNLEASLVGVYGSSDLLHPLSNEFDDWRPMAQLILVFRLCVAWLLTAAATNATQRQLKLHLVTSAVLQVWLMQKKATTLHPFF